MADGATKELREGLGPELCDFDVRELHPGNFVRERLFDGLDSDDDGASPGTAESEGEYLASQRPPSPCANDKTSTFDPEAT